MMWGAEGNDIGGPGSVKNILEELESETFSPASGIDDKRGVRIVVAVSVQQVGDAGDIVTGIIARSGISNMVGADCREMSSCKGRTENRGRKDIEG